MKRRIEQIRILWTLYRTWRRVADQRAGQLIDNAVTCPLFYLEDAELREYLRRYPS